MNWLLPGHPNREMTFCAGCPHRASFWSIHQRSSNGQPAGICVWRYRLLFPGHAPHRIQHIENPAFNGLRNPALPADLGNCASSALTSRCCRYAATPLFFMRFCRRWSTRCITSSDITLVVLDNSGTAMTGFQPHPGLTGGCGRQRGPRHRYCQRVAQAMGADGRRFVILLI